MSSTHHNWERLVEHAEFSPRDTSEGVVFRDKMWLSNAYHHGNVLVRDLWNSTDGIHWSQVSDDTPYDGYSEMVVFEDRLFAVKRSVWVSDDGERWTKILDETPFGMTGYGELIVYKGKMWQIGPGPEVWSSTDGEHWECATDAAACGDRRSSATVLFDDKLWRIAGNSEEKNSPEEKGYPQFTTWNDVWCSTDGAEWTRVLEHAPWAPRMWCRGRAYAGALWLIGGFDNANHTNLGDVWFTRDGVNWTEFISDPVFAPRHEPTLYTAHDALWVVAGNTWPVVNDVWRLTLPEGWDSTN